MIKSLDPPPPQDSQYNISWGGKTRLKPQSTQSMAKRRFRLTPATLKKYLPFILGAFVILYFFLVRPLMGIASGVRRVETKAKELKASFQANDIELVKTKLGEFSKTYEVMRSDARGIYWLSFIPYIGDLKNGIEGGHYSVEAAKEGVTAILPYADLIGFKKGQSSFTDKSAEDRLQTAVVTLDKMLSRIDPISANIEKAEEHISQINPNRYPKSFGKTQVRDRIVNIKEQFYGMSSLFVDAKPLLKKLPHILGKDKEQTYLILFQNNYERRATGGFLTSYAFFRIKDGRMQIARSEDIYSLDNSISRHPTAPKEILTFHKGVNQFFIRDSNLSPDLPASIKLFESLYDLSNIDQKYDGIVMLDAKVLVDMLKIFGDTEAGGIRFSANIDDRCNCPQVIYQLFDIVDRPVNYIKTDRKGILGDLMFALFYKAIGFSPSQYWGTLAQTMFRNLEEKHILLNFKERDLQDSVEKINFAGRIRPFEGDYLHVNNVNFAGAKSNLFVKEVIESVTTRKDGKLQKEVTITYTNPYAHSDCNLERGGLCLNATLRNWLRVYVPQGSKLVSMKGSQTKVNTYNELGKTVFEGFLTVNPQGRAQVIVTYELPESVKTDDGYMVQKQPGVEKQEVKVIVNGQTLYNGPFAKDLVLK